MQNEQRDQVGLEIGGKRRPLVFDWEALAELRAEIGPEFDVKIAQAGYEFNTGVLAVALSVGLKRHWPEVTPEIVRAASPPIIEVIKTLERALHPAMYGDKEAIHPNRKARRASASAIAKSVFRRMTFRQTRPESEEHHG